MRPIKIAYLSSENPHNKKVWSGTHYSIYKQLCGLGEVSVLGPYSPMWQVLLGKVINQICLRISGKRFDYRHSFLVSKAYGRFFNKRLAEVQPDIIVAPAASCELAFMRYQAPIFYITDGTFGGCLNYHKALTNLLTFNIRQGNEIEKKAIHLSHTVIVSSEWAAYSAIHDYGADQSKVKVMPFGANFEKLPAEQELNFEAPNEWKLLFVGVYWESKGGAIAFNAFKLLADKGYPVSFTVLGCIPPSHISHPKMTVIPFIDKNDPTGQQRLFEIYKAHHVLLLPTRFDCTPIVINEASAFGMPCLVAKTGGVAGHLHEGVNGYLVDYNDEGEGYAALIEHLILKPEEYLSLRKSTRHDYVLLLNWEKWKNDLSSLFPLKIN